MKKAFYIFLSILCLSFIFFNSSQDGTKSNIRSNNVVEKVITDVKENKISTPIISKIHINMKQFNLVLRKFAHGFEFAILSIILFRCLTFFKINKGSIKIYTLFLILLSAVVDEFLQLYIPGRNSSVKDVVIDFIGGCFGLLIIEIVLYIKCKYNDKITKNKITIL